MVGPYIILFIMSLLGLTNALEARGTWNPYPNTAADKATDILNVVGCHYAAGLGNETTYYFPEDGTVEVIFAPEDRNDSLAIGVAMRCHQGMNATFTMLYSSGVTDDISAAQHLSIEEIVLARAAIPIYASYRNMGLVDRYGAGGNSTYGDLSKRSKYIEYYEVFGSAWYDCSNEEMFFTSTDICQDDNMNPFWSVQLYNPNCVELIANIWPHHRCEKGDFKYVNLACNQWSDCIKRTTYSWYGTLLGDSCHTHESAVNCSQAEVDEWYGNITPGITNYGGSYKNGGFGYKSYDY